MIYEYHIVLAAIAAVIGLLSFVPYFRDILNGSTKPHIFSWFVWSLLVGITFLIQISQGGGIGAWVTGLESICCFAVTIFAFTRGEKNIIWTDWVCLAGALIAIILWQLAHQPLLAVIFLVLADGFGYVPTLVKSYRRPQEETAAQYALSSVRWFLGTMALGSLTLTTWLYPAWAGTLDISLVATLLIRRKQLKTA